MTSTGYPQMTFDEYHDVHGLAWRFNAITTEAA